jgi:hypothetical protein
MTDPVQHDDEQPAAQLGGGAGLPQEPVPQEPVPQEPVPQQPVPQQPVPQQPVPQQPVAAGNGGGAGAQPQHDKFWSKVQQTRAWAGMLVVFVGAAAIAGVTLWGLTKANSTNTSSIVAILSSAFTAIATMITAYFGIRAVTNTAQSAVGDTPGKKQQGGNQQGGNQ